MTKSGFSVVIIAVLDARPVRERIGDASRHHVYLTRSPGRRTRRKRRNQIARGSVAGAVLGGWLGFAVGVVPGLGGASSLVAWSSLIGSVVGGGVLGFRWTSHRTDGIVYRAPLDDQDRGDPHIINSPWLSAL
jgi:uncharacterized protein YcfJ